MYEQYKIELERLQLSTEDKKDLTESLSRTKTATKGLRRMLRLSTAAAVAICSLVIVASGAAIVIPVLRDYFGGQGYDQSSALLGYSVDQDGWTMKLTDCVGNDRFLYLGLELTGPTGTVLDHDDYQMDFEYHFRDLNSYGAQLQQIADSDPYDNSIRFILWIEGFDYSDNGQFDNSFNGQPIELKLNGLYRKEWNGPELERIYESEAEWDFGHQTISYADNAIRLKPNQAVNVLDTSATITSIEVTPIGVCVVIEGDGLKGHHANFSDGRCYGEPDVTLYDKTGTPFLPDSSLTPFGVRSGSGCAGGTDTSDTAYLRIVQSYGYLLDMETLGSIEICGVKIPLS